MAIGDLPFSRREVEWVQKTSFIGLSKSILYNPGYISDQVMRLMNIRDEIYKKEMEFFSYVAPGISDPRAALEFVQKKIDVVNSSHLNLDQIQEKVRNDPRIGEIIEKITRERIDDELSKINFTFNDIITPPTKEELLSRVVEEIAAGVEKAKSDDFKVVGVSTNIRGGKSNDLIGIAKILDVTYSVGQNNIYNVTAKINPNIKKIDSTKINQLAAFISSEQQTTKEDALLRQKLKDIVREILINSTAGPFRQFIGQQVIENIDKYDLTRNFFSLKGFVQEVWTNAMLEYIYGAYGKSIPTGNVRNKLENGAEIPIDAVLNDFNFQIKSFSLKNGKYTIHEQGKSIGTFLKRYRIDVADALINLFGVYQWNIPFTGNNASATTPLYEKEVYNPIKDRVTNKSYLDSILQPHLDTILRINNAIEGEELFTQGIYFQTFFIINNKIIPASAMIDGIIRELSKENSSSGPAMQFKTQGISSPVAGNTLDSVISTSHFESYKGRVGSLAKMADQIKIYYRIKIDFNQIINNAYSYV